jgi:hypothetical protein
VLQWWRNLKKNEDLALVSNLIQISQPVIWAGAAMAGLAVFVPAIFVPVAAGAAGSAVICAALWIAVVIARNKAARRRDWNPSIWMRRRKSHIVVHSPTNIYYRAELDLLILQDDIRRFNWRIGWTGEGSTPQSGIEASIVNPGFSWYIQSMPADSANTLVVEFDRPRNKGEELLLVIELNTNGDLKNQRPFYSIVLHESRLPLALTIGIEFSATVAVHSVQKEEYVDHLAAWPMCPPEPVALGISRALEWKIRPRRHGRYSVTWKYG